MLSGYDGTGVPKTAFSMTVTFFGFCIGLGFGKAIAASHNFGFEAGLIFSGADALICALIFQQAWTTSYRRQVVALLDERVAAGLQPDPRKPKTT